MKKAVFYAHLLDTVKQENIDMKAVMAKVRSLGFEGLDCLGKYCSGMLKNISQLEFI